MTMPGIASKPVTRSREATVRPVTMARAAPVARTSRSSWPAPSSGLASPGRGDIAARVPSKSRATSPDGRAARSASTSTSTSTSPLAHGEQDFHVTARRGQLERLGDLGEGPGGGDEVRGPDGSPAEQAGRFLVVLREIRGAALNADLVVLHDRQRDGDLSGRDADDYDRPALVGHGDRLVYRGLDGDAVEHDVGAPAERLPHLTGNVRCSRVDGGMGAEGRGPLALGGIGVGADHFSG